MSKIISDIMKSIPLETRIKVTIESHFIMKHGGSFFMPASEEGEEYEEICRINGEALKEAQPLIDSVMENIKSWKEDGMPEKKK